MRIRQWLCRHKWDISDGGIQYVDCLKCGKRITFMQLWGWDLE